MLSFHQRTGQFYKIKIMINSFVVVENDIEYKFTQKPVERDGLSEISISLLYALLINLEDSANIIVNGKSLVIKDPILGFMKVRIASYEEELINTNEENLDVRCSLHIERLSEDEVPVLESRDTYFVKIEEGKVM